MSQKKFSAFLQIQAVVGIFLYSGSSVKITMSLYNRELKLFYHLLQQFSLHVYFAFEIYFLEKVCMIMLIVCTFVS